MVGVLVCRRAVLAGAVTLAGASLVAGAAAQDCSGLTFVASSAVVTGLAVFDIATAPASVRRFNERQVAIAPVVNLRDRAYGVSVSVALRRAPAPPPLRQQASHRPKSPTTGLLLSLGSTTVPMGTGVLMGANSGAWVFLGGLVVGPSVGHFYAGATGRAVGTTALRAASAAVGISSLVGCFSD